MRIKVAHVVRQYHPSVGGMEDVVQNIAAQQLERHGQSPKIITLDRLFRNSTERLTAYEMVNGIPVVRLPYRGSSRYPLCLSVLRHVADADVIHVHGIDFFFDYLAATKRIHGRPIMASTHGGFFHTPFASALKKLYFNSVTRASSWVYDRMIATSDNDGEFFGKIVRPSKMVVIENGVNVEKYRDQAAARLTPTLIYFGRWSANKGLMETIGFFKELVAREPAWKLIIAGREYDHSKEELAALLRKYALTDSVELVSNPSGLELANLIARASYFISLSRHEGFGIAPIEAMSAGLTPVLSDIPPFRNLVEQSGLGVLLARASGEPRIACLLALHARGQDDYTARRASARAFVERYNWKHVVDKYVAVYSALANKT